MAHVVAPELILTVLLSLPAHGTDAGEHPDARELRLAPVASAISTAARTTQEAAALIAQGFGESGFAGYVIEDRCHEGPKGARCDPDRQGRARARGPWQVWAVACPDAWALPAGHASLHLEARCAVRLLRGGRQRCGDWEGAFASMGGGARCTSARAPARVRSMGAAQTLLARARDAR